MPDKIDKPQRLTHDRNIKPSETELNEKSKASGNLAFMDEPKRNSGNPDAILNVLLG